MIRGFLREISFLFAFVDMIVAMLLGTVLLAASADNCQYWVQQESNAGGYTHFNLTGTGLIGNKTISGGSG